MRESIHRSNLLLRGPGCLEHVQRSVIRSESIDRRYCVDVVVVVVVVVVDLLLFRAVLELLFAHAHIVVIRLKSARMTPDTIIVPEAYRVHFRPDTMIEEIQRFLPSGDNQTRCKARGCRHRSRIPRDRNASVGDLSWCSRRVCDYACTEILKAFVLCGLR